MGKTPICPNCGTKFPGDPCTKCSMSAEVAQEQKQGKMPSATRKHKKHGRQ